MNERTAAAQSVVKRYWKWSAGAGLIPIPLLDMAAVTAIQLKMIADLARLYEIPFREDRAKSITGALVASVAPPFLSGGALAFLSPVIRLVPGIGPTLGVLAVPAFNAAATYALGRVFTQHFESGGTFLDMNPDAVREHFYREFEAGGRRRPEASAAH